MINAEFIYEGQSSIIQSKLEDKMKDLFQKFANKSEIDLNKLNFLYGGTVINKDSTLSQIIGSSPKDVIKILVFPSDGADEPAINPNESFTRPKFIMCPKCKENIRYNITNYKINLFDCRKGHKINNILLNEFNNIQKYDMSKIICQQCKNQNKKETTFNEFYKCLTCELYLCPLCKTIHDKNHNIINMDKNYICSIHNEPYSKYCLDCRINSCIQCSNNHRNHNNIYLGDIIPNLNEINDKLKELRNSINIFKQNINEIIEKLNSIVDNFEMYYKLNEFMISNYPKKDRNFEVLKNINEINNCYSIINILDNINNEKDVIIRLNKILNLYNMMNNKDDINNEIIVKYNLKENDSNDNLCSNFNIVYETLEKIKGSTPNIKNFDFYKFLSSILLYEFNQNDHLEFRELILNKILSKNDLIKYSSPIINILIEKSGIKSSPLEFDKNIKNLKEGKSSLLSLLNKTKNDFLEEIIMNIFERKIIKYFELIPSLMKKSWKIIIKYFMNKMKMAKY